MCVCVWLLLLLLLLVHFFFLCVCVCVYPLAKLCTWHSLTMIASRSLSFFFFSLSLLTKSWHLERLLKLEKKPLLEKLNAKFTEVNSSYTQQKKGNGSYQPFIESSLVIPVNVCLCVS